MVAEPFIDVVFVGVERLDSIGLCL